MNEKKYALLKYEGEKYMLLTVRGRKILVTWECGDENDTCN